MPACGAWRLLPLLLAALPALAEPITPGARVSGFEMMGPELKALQRDDFENPAMLAVREGEQLFGAAPASGKPACAGCHGAVEGLAGVAARYPAYEAESGAPVDLAGRIALCQARHQSVSPSPRESRALVALEALIALQSRGQPIAPPADSRLDAARAAGKALFGARMGQLGLACADCHDENWGKRLGGTRIPQGHPTGYPLFRLEWQATGTLQRRLRNCMTGVRAEPFAYGSAEFIALELYLRDRAAGMALDAPGVRP